MFPDGDRLPKSVRPILVFLSLAAVAALLAWLLAPLIVPILLSFVLYAALEPLSGALARRGMGPGAAALTVLTGLGIAVALAVSFLFPYAARQLQQVNERLPVVWETLNDAGRAIAGEIEARFGVRMELDRLVEFAGGLDRDWTREIVIEGSNFLVTTAGILLLLPLFTFFLIRDWKDLRSRMLNLLPNRSFELGWLIYHRVAGQLQNYVRGVVLQSTIMTLITAVGFHLAGFEAPVVLGLIAGILNLIPYLGPLLAMIPPVVLVLGQPPLDPWMLGAAVGIVLVGQLVDNLIVVPAVIANVVRLHPLVVIGGVIVFGNFFGLLGMIVAIPVLSTANIVLGGLVRGLRGAGPLRA